jgi:hypothetical protein
MSFSEKVGANALGLKINACTPSLNFETCFSISSAEKLVRHVAAGQQRQRAEAGAARIKRRRVRSGMVFTASLMSSVLSTPGISRLRMRPMSYSLVSGR